MTHISDGNQYLKSRFCGSYCMRRNILTKMHLPQNGKQILSKKYPVTLFWIYFIIFIITVDSQYTLQDFNTKFTGKLKRASMTNTSEAAKLLRLNFGVKINIHLYFKFYKSSCLYLILIHYSI